MVHDSEKYRREALIDVVKDQHSRNEYFSQFKQDWKRFIEKATSYNIDEKKPARLLLTKKRALEAKKQTLDVLEKRTLSVYRKKH